MASDCLRWLSSAFFPPSSAESTTLYYSISSLYTTLQALMSEGLFLPSFPLLLLLCPWSSLWLGLLRWLLGFFGSVKMCTSLRFVYFFSCLWWWVGVGGLVCVVVVSECGFRLGGVCVFLVCLVFFLVVCVGRCFPIVWCGGFRWLFVGVLTVRVWFNSNTF